MFFLSSIFSLNAKAKLTKSSYEELFKSHYALLCRLIVKIVKDKSIAEDIVQDIFIKLWEKRETLSIEVSLKSYLYRAAINSSYTYLEKNKKYPKIAIEDASDLLEDNHSDSQKQLEAKELEAKIEATLRLLPDACREVFLLSRWEGMRYKEIADTLSISEKTVENQMGKALRIFRESLFTSG